LSAPRPEQNQLLAALPDVEHERLFAYLEPIEMPLGEALTSLEVICITRISQRRA